MSDTPTPITEPIQRSLDDELMTGSTGDSWYNPPEGQRGHASGKDGTYTVDDLKRDVAVSASLKRQKGGAELSRDEAVKMLLERFSSGKDRGLTSALYLIVDSLPPDLLTENSLGPSGIDLRPYFATLDKKKIVMPKPTGLIDDITDLEAWTLGIAQGAARDLITGSGGVDRDEVSLDEQLKAENTRIRETLSGIQSGTDLTDTARQSRIDRLTKYDPASAGILPQPDDATLAYLTGQSDFAPVEGEAQKGRWSRDDMAAVLNMSLADMDSDFWTTVVNQEATMQQEYGGGYFPVVIDEGQFTRSSRPGTIEGGTTTGAVTLSALDAAGYLTTLTDAEVKNMQMKLAAAGFFDQTSSGSSYVEGDAYDKVTNEAWRLALGESALRNIPVTQVIGERGKNYRSTQRAARMKGLTELDPSYTRVLADDWAQATIGRRLSPEEQDALHLQLQLLVSRRAGFVAGASDNTATEGLVGDMGVDQNDVTLALENQYSVEQRQTAFTENWSRLAN